MANKDRRSNNRLSLLPSWVKWFNPLLQISRLVFCRRERATEHGYCALKKSGCRGPAAYEPRAELPHRSRSTACTRKEADFCFLPHIAFGGTHITGVNSILKKESWKQINVILNTHRKHICSKMRPLFIYNHFSGKNWILNINLCGLALDKAKIKRESALESLHLSSGTCNPSLLTLTIFRTLYVHTPVGNIRASHILSS